MSVMFLLLISGMQVAEPLNVTEMAIDDGIRKNPRYRICPPRQELGNLIDSHGGRHVRVRTPKKVLQHLMYGVLVIAVEQTMRLLS